MMDVKDPTIGELEQYRHTLIDAERSATISPDGLGKIGAIKATAAAIGKWIKQTEQEIKRLKQNPREAARRERAAEKAGRIERPSM